MSRCVTCGQDIQGRSDKRTCSPRCRMALSRRLRVVRIPHRLMEFMEGTGWWQGERWSGDPAEDSLVSDLKAKLIDAPVNSDRSVSLWPDGWTVRFLRGQAANLESVARDDSGWDADARADLNSARGFLRRTHSS